MNDIQHGTTYGYRKGCRCDPCKEAKREDWKRYKEQQASQVDPFDDFEGQQEPDQIAEMVKTLVLRIKCDMCYEWHLGGEDCPQGTL
jgi:ribosomal protein L44E